MSTFFTKTFILHIFLYKNLYLFFLQGLYIFLMICVYLKVCDAFPNITCICKYIYKYAFAHTDVYIHMLKYDYKPSYNHFISFFLSLYLYIYIYIYSPVGWGCRIHQLLLCRGVRPPTNECLGYDTKQSDGEV